MPFSDGTLRFMCLATLLLQPQLPTTLLLDEPELGLHPFAITLLADLLRGAGAVKKNAGHRLDAIHQPREPI